MRNRRNIRGRQTNTERKKRLFSAFLLILSIVALTGGTYAWFTNNQSISNDDISIGVKPGSVLKISTDATPNSWKDTIVLDDIINADYTYGVTRYNNYPTMYRPVSSAGYVNSNGFGEFFLGHISKKITGGYKISAEAVTEQDGSEGYLLSFDLYFKTGSNQVLNLDARNSRIRYKHQETDRNTTEGIENAVRMAFIYQGSIVDESNVHNIQALHGDSTSAIKIWEPNDDVHNTSAIAAAKEFYNLTINDGDVVSYEGVKAAIPENLGISLGVPNSTYFESLGTKLISTHKTAADEISLFNINDGVSKVRVYLWIEGQDVDCENEVSGTSFEIDLVFNSTNIL